MEVPGGMWQASQAKVLFLQKLVGHVSASFLSSGLPEGRALLFAFGSPAPVPRLAQRMYPERMDGQMGGWAALGSVSFIDPSNLFHLLEQGKQNDTLLALLQGSGL